MGVAVMGVGISGAVATSDGLSYRELIADAARAAYQDAGIEPSQLDGVVSVEEDFVSGYSIADEYVPDQLGMVRKPVYTVCGDFLHGFGSAVMQIETGRFDMLVVEAYSKASNVLEKDELLHFAFDPVFERLGVSPHYLAAIEMQHYLASGGDLADVAGVVRRNRASAMANPAAPYGAAVGADDVIDARPVATPLTDLMFARHADAAVCVVVGSTDAAERYARKPVAVLGTGWASANSIVQRRDLSTSEGTRLAAAAALGEANIDDITETDVVYLSDLYAHRQLMHMAALGLAELETVNPDGGALGGGDLLEATGGARLVDAVRQIRGEAGAHQVADAASAFVHGWRGLPTDSCAVAVLGSERR
jgi:acetyl-CoA C-acetyltransferase